MRFMHGRDLSVSSKYHGLARLISSTTSVFRLCSANEDRLEERKLIHATDPEATLCGSTYSATGRSEVATNSAASAASPSTLSAPVTSAGETVMREMRRVLRKSFANESELDSSRRLSPLNFATLERAQSVAVMSKPQRADMCARLCGSCSQRCPEKRMPMLRASPPVSTPKVLCKNSLGAGR